MFLYFLLTLLILTSCRQCYYSNQVYLNYNHDWVNGSQCIPCHYRCTQCSAVSVQGCLADSCQQGYYYTANGTCEACSPNCISCTSPNECLACTANYYLLGQGCTACPSGASSCSSSAVVSCQPGYFYDSARLQCLQCMTNCSSCQSLQSCSSCLPRLFYQSASNSCVACSANCELCSSSTVCDTCSKGYRTASDGTCAAYNCTVANCLECPNGPAACTLCKQGFYAKNSQCVAGTSLLCGIARGPDFGGCLSCSSYSIQPDDTVSYCIIPPVDTVVSFIYLTALNNPEAFNNATVQLCDHTLTTAQNSYTITIAFPAAYQAEISFSLVYFVAGSNFTYSLSLQPSANSSVDSMSFWDSQQTSTESCNNTAKLFVSSVTFIALRTAYSQLVIAGSQPFSIHEVLFKFSLCQVLNCSVCSSAAKCVSCQAQLLLQKGSCVASCSSGYYIDVVHRSCVYVCPLGLYLDPPSYQCLQCPYPCASCTAMNVCLSCLSTTTNPTFLDGGSCVSSCLSATTYENATTGRCEICTSPCLTCSRSGTNCTSCSAGYFVLNGSTGSCAAQCPAGRYGSFNGAIASCEFCSPSCATCSLNSTNCESCTIGKFLFGGSCGDGCKVGFYGSTERNQCLPCSAPCASCNGSAANCSSCSFGVLVVATGTGKCVSACPTGQYSLNMVCTPCPLECKECVNATYCLACNNLTTNPTTGTQTVIYYLQSNLCKSTCSTGWMDRTTNRCSPCQHPCQTCQQDFVGNVCITCHAGLLLQNLTCVLACSNGLYRSASDVCVACASGCLQCTNLLGCTSCQQPQPSADLADAALLFVLRNGQCLNKTGCASFEFVAKNITTGGYVCNRCDQSCLTCGTHATNCLSCSPQLILSGGRCVANCDIGYYNNSNSCSPCSAECKQCTGGTASACLACNPPYYLLLSSCGATCPNGYYGNSVSNTCEFCPGGCATCISGYSCTSCSIFGGQQYYLLNSRCVQSCPTGTITQSLPLFQCVMCAVTCATCSAAADNCTSCFSGLYIQGGSTTQVNTCVQSCPLGQYPEGSTMSCQFCRAPCLTCLSLSQCSSCLNNSGAANQTYLYQQNCLTACPAGTFPNVTSISCQNCSYPCRTCTASNCLACSSGTFMINQQCVLQCPDYFYGDQPTASCLSCNPPCVLCLSSTICSSCQAGYSLKSGICLNACPKGTYPNNSTGSCSNCSDNCEQCSVAPSICTSCKPSLILNSAAGSCVTSCPFGLYPAPNIQLRLECKLCSPACASCTTFTKCTSCRDPLLLQNNECLQNCSVQYFPSNGVCLSCSANCSTCLNSSVCLRCTSLFLWNGSCTSNCPKGTYKDYLLLQCSSCSTNCAECSSLTNCSMCEGGYALLSGFCVKLPCRLPYYSRPESSACLLQCLPNDFVWNGTCYSKCPLTLVTRTDTRQCVTSCPTKQFINPRLQCQQCADSICSQANFNFSLQYISKADSIQVVVVFSRPYSAKNNSTFTVQLGNNLTVSTARILATQSTSSAVTGRFLSLEFNPGVSLRNQQLVVTTTGSYDSGFADESGNVLQNYRSTVDVASYDYYGKSGTPALAIILMGAVLLFTAGLIYFGMHHLIWDAFDYCQLLFFVCFLPVQLPPSLDEFVFAFLATHIKFPVTGSPAVNNSSYKYYQYTTDINFLRNAACDIIIFAFLGLLIIASYLVVRLKERIICGRLVEVASKIWSNKCLIALEAYLLTSLNAAHFSFAQLYDTNTRGDAFLRFNMFVTCVALVASLAIPLIVCGWLYHQLTQKVKDATPHHLFFKDMDMSKAEIGLMFNGFRLLRRVLWVVLLGLYPLNEVYGLAAMVLASATIISVLAMYRPYASNLRNNIVVAQEAILLGVFCTLMLLVLNKTDNLTGKMALGGIVQVECACLIVVSLVWPAMSLYRVVKQQAEQERDHPIREQDLQDGIAKQDVLAAPIASPLVLPRSNAVVPREEAGPVRVLNPRDSGDGQAMQESSASINRNRIKTYDATESEHAPG